MVKILSDELQPIIAQLDQAIHNHEQWLKTLNRTLTCRSRCDERDLAGDAYRRCLFGQWYYGHAPQKLREHPAFLAVEAEHRRMHEHAGRLLASAAAGTPILPADYDEMANAMERMHLQIYTLKHELEESVYRLDPLTGAFSRLSMLTTLREQRELVRRRVHPCCIAILDLDHFKAVNDTYGHLAGDAVLAAVVRRMTARLRPYDSVFRYGGEEFLVCMLNADLDTGFVAAERLRKEIASAPVEAGGACPVAVTASFGIALLRPDIPVEQSIACADRALLKAKTCGRNCSVRGEDPAA
jgi:diguanylate cyclase (GGDEF)-like protein